MNRRQFLSLSATGMGSVLLTQCARPSLTGMRQSGIATDLTPATITREPGLVHVVMDARQSALNFAGQQQVLYSYSGQIPGPRIEANPGDTVRIELTNALPDPTNLHFHGLHISPSGSGDDVFLKLPPGEAHTYDFQIPADHPGGVVYYHPHAHGTVAKQILGGLGGMIVVRGELDQIPEIQAAQEQFVFLKDFSTTDNWQGRNAWQTGLMAGREGGIVTINGALEPTWSMPASGLLRLQLVNASNARFYRLALEAHPFYLISTDGHPIEKPVELSELLLVPGERAEVLVQAQPNRSGEFHLMDMPYERGGSGMMGGGMMRGHHGGGAGPTKAQPLATIRYDAASITQPVALPNQLVAISSLPRPKEQRRFRLNHGMSPGRGMVFLINGKAFDPKRIDTRVQLGSTEEWVVSNTGVMDHPFHLHVNPFQIISRNGQPEPFRAWKDTVVVKTGETLRLHVRFTDFPGKTVYHCHILDHEERAMMGVIEMA